MIDEIERVAVRSKQPILLMGPTGAGKSLLATRVYELKKSRHQIKGEFVEVNCTTLRGDAAMSTLFGHVKGAFTGAQTERAGLLRKADQGLVFLDEIGELGTDEQAMLLKAIEEKRFFPLGADKETRSDFQLIAGTNRDLRDRSEDIEPNIDYELERHSQANASNVRFNAEAKATYLRFATSSAAQWIGNFREPSASVTRMATMTAGGRITEDNVRDELQRLQANWQPKRDSELDELLPPAAINSLDLFDRMQLEAVIGICRQSNSLADAGRKLYAASRANRAITNDTDRLRKYLARFDLDWASIVAKS